MSCTPVSLAFLDKFLNVTATVTGWAVMAPLSSTLSLTIAGVVANVMDNAPVPTLNFVRPEPSTGAPELDVPSATRSSVAVPGLDALTSKAKLLLVPTASENGGGTLAPTSDTSGDVEPSLSEIELTGPPSAVTVAETATGWPTATGPASPGVVTLTASEVPLVVVVVVADETGQTSSIANSPALTTFPL